MGGPFSLRRLSPLGSPAGGAGQTQMAALGMFRVAGVVSQREETGLFFFCVCRYPCINNTAWDASMRLEYFCNAKGQRDFKSTLAFLVSHEACRRMAVFSIQLAGSYTRPASREACCRAAVSPQPSRISPECPAPYGRGVGCRGSPPAASREACCRAAVKPRPTCFPSSTPAPYGRGVGCRGTAPARPASRGPCRATAVKPQPTRMFPYAPARLRRAVRKGLSPSGALPLPDGSRCSI